MAIENDELNQLIHNLTQEGIPESVFYMRWVDFICDNLPTLDANDLDELIEYLNYNIKNSFLTLEHYTLLENILVQCFGNEDSFQNSLKIGYALAQTCDLCEPNELEQHIFENITTAKTAKELFAYMAVTNDRNFLAYLTYLNRQGVINLDDWDTSRRWQGQESGILEKTDNVPVRLFQRQQDYLISDAAQARFPFLQGVIDEYCKDPAFATLWPILPKLASQVAREGTLTRSIALLGPPGVGKTESARLLQKILRAMNACGDDFCVFSPGKDTGQFVDQMANRMRKLLFEMKQNGGLLLVDEAGKFLEGAHPNAPAAFRKRTLDVVFEQLDDLAKSDVVVVFAGYRHEFEKVLQQDAGFGRRVQMIDIEPPSAELLAKKVWASFVARGISLPPNFEYNTTWLFEQMISDDSMNFGYWATANNFENALLDNVEEDFLLIGDKHSNEVNEDDFKKAASDIGFISTRINTLDFSRSISADETPDSVFEAEIRSFFEPPSPPDIGRQIE